MKQTVEPPTAEEIQVRVEPNIEFTLRVARDFARRRVMSGIETADFESAALLGLCDAARRFDSSKGMNFRTFAYFRIKGAMLDHLRRSGRIPRLALKKLIAEKAAQQQAEEQRSGAEDSDEDVFPLPFAANLADLAELAQIAAHLGFSIVPSCADSGDELTYLDAQTPEQASIGSNLRAFLSTFIERLPADQRRVIEMRYFHDRTLEEIRDQFNGVSKSWLSRLHGHAIDNLRLMVEDANRGALARYRTAEESQSATYTVGGGV